MTEFNHSLNPELQSLVEEQTTWRDRALAAEQPARDGFEAFIEDERLNPLIDEAAELLKGFLPGGPNAQYRQVLQNFLSVVLGGRDLKRTTIQAREIAEKGPTNVG